MAHIQISRDESGRIKVLLPYDPELIAKIKTITGRRWHPEEKCWNVPDSDGVLDKLFSLFAGEQLEIAPPLRHSTTGSSYRRDESKRAQILEAMDQELKLRGYGTRTRKAYLGHIERFINTHVSQRNIAAIRSPLYEIMTRRGESEEETKR